MISLAKSAELIYRIFCLKVGRISVGSGGKPQAVDLLYMKLDGEIVNKKMHDGKLNMKLDGRVLNTIRK